MPFLLAEILNFQGSTHLNGVGSLSFLHYIVLFCRQTHYIYAENIEKTYVLSNISP